MWAALIFGAGPFTAACMGPIRGALGDRFGKKSMADRHGPLLCLFGLALGPLLGAFVVRGAHGPDFRFAFVVGALLCGVAGTGMLLLRRLERRPAT